MKKALLVIVIVAIIGISGGIAISPIFTNTTINEDLPDTVVSHEIKNEDSISKQTLAEEKTIQTYEGEFVGTGDGIHNVEGIVRIISLENGDSVLRLENFKATNGPDLYVYLATDTQSSEYISLGKLKANNGNQNYDIPENTNLEKYNKVLIWCKPFGVLFGSANLSS